jgi:hypothetical protein
MSRPLTGTYTEADFTDAVGVRSAVHEIGEPPQHLGSPHARTDAAQLDHIRARSLERRIGERLRLVQRSPVPVVAGVECPPSDESFQSQAFTRHGSKGRAELGESFAL